jgi:hypothetical protein
MHDRKISLWELQAAILVCAIYGASDLEAIHMHDNFIDVYLDGLL